MSFLTDAVQGAAGFANSGLSKLTGESPQQLAGDMLTGGAMSNARSVELTNQLSMEESQRNRDFQERMSNSAYQRSMEDMRKAGLNPMLASSLGGASVPSGSTASFTAPQTGDIGAGLVKTAGVVAGMNNTSAQTASIKASTNKMETVDTDKTVADTNLASVNYDKTKQEANNATAQEHNIRSQNDKIKAETMATKASTAKTLAELPAITAESAIRKKQAELSGKGIVPYIDASLKRILPTAKTVSDFFPITRAAKGVGTIIKSAKGSK